MKRLETSERLRYTTGLLRGGKGDVELALGALREIVTKGPRSGRGTECTQSAARALLEHYRWAVDCEREDEAPLKELAAILGSDEAALAFIEAKLPELRARVTASRAANVAAVRQLGPAERDEDERPEQQERHGQRDDVDGGDSDDGSGA